MGDPEEPTVKEGRFDTPTVDHARSSPKIADSQPTTPESRAFDPGRERFETRGELGRGGMGRVDEAYDHALGRQVAIKHVLSQAKVDLARFEREARITAKLEHPGIVPVHDIGRDADGTPYYIMRRFDGQPLSDLVGDKPLAERLRLVPNLLTACDAAAFAHSHGVVHRDIKPTNILVGPFGETLLIDWGLAREVTQADDKGSAIPVSDSNLTRAGTVAGTPGFMSPEQARGETVDARADVFALGATLFYLLAGQLPWHGGSTEMIDHVSAGRPADWRLMPSEVPADLRAIVEKAMAVNLEERYVDASALAADLRNYTLGNLVVAYEYGWFARLARFVRRHRGAVSIAVVSVVVLAVVGVVSIRRVLAERDDANRARALAEKRQREARDAADRLLLAHARELVDVDPTEAIAALRTLPPDSPEWPQAWGVASGAFYKGIPIGFIGMTEPATPQIAADNRHAFVAGFMTGHIILIDLVKRESRDLGNVGLVDGVAWFDTTHFICVTKEGAIVIDIAHDTRRTIREFARASLYSNREGLAVFLADHKLFELTSADGKPRMIEADVDGYAPSSDLKAAVISRGHHRELWSGGKTYALPDVPPDVNPNLVTYRVADGFVASFESPTLNAWDVIDDEVVRRGSWTEPYAMTATLYADHTLFVAGSNSFQRADRLGAAISGEFATFLQTRTGLVLGTADGRLWIRDRKGWFKLGRRHSAFQRLDQSIDGRMLMATTLTGEVVVFDLGPLRPETVEVPPTEMPMFLTRDALWTHLLGVGLIRRELGAQDGTVEISRHTLANLFATSADQHTVAALDLDFHVLDLAEIGKPAVTEHDVTGFGVTETGMIFGKSNGEIWRWDPKHRTLIAKLDGPVEIVADSDADVLAIVGERQLVRIDVQTRAQERLTLPPPISRIAIAIDGTAWFIADGVGYRWDRNASAPTKLETFEPVDGLLLVGKGAVFHTPRSFLVFESTVPRIIAKASAYFINIGGDLVAANDAQGNVAIVDPFSGASFDLPLQLSIVGQNLMRTEPDRLGYGYSLAEGGMQLVGIFDLAVPRDPAKLRQWLATITNAKPLPNSEAVAWP